MHIQIFNIPLTDSGEGLLELNRFLTGHKVLEVSDKMNNRPKKQKKAQQVRIIFEVACCGFYSFLKIGRAVTVHCF